MHGFDFEKARTKRKEIPVGNKTSVLKNDVLLRFNLYLKFLAGS